MGKLSVLGNSRTRRRLADVVTASGSNAVATGGTVTTDTPTLVEHTFSAGGTFALILTGLLPVTYTISGTGTFGGSGVSGSTNVIANVTVTVTSGTVVVAYDPRNYVSGGTVTQAGGKTYHTFTTNGTFAVGSNVAPLSVDYMVQGGGGSGSPGTNGSRWGGGGAGGIIRSGSTTLSATHGVTVGSSVAGTAVNATPGTNGNSSALGAVATATGGNGGPANSGTGATNADFTGGAVGAISGPGGAGSGANGSSQNGGNGTEWPTASGVFYGGGGGGVLNSGPTPGSGGTGGGGAGSTTNGVAGTNGLGGGGGGCGSAGTSGAGGSGVVIVRYNTP